MFKRFQSRIRLQFITISPKNLFFFLDKTSLLKNIQKLGLKNLFYSVGLLNSYF